MPGSRLDWKKAKDDANRSVLVPTGEEIAPVEEQRLQAWWITRATDREGRRVLKAGSAKVIQTAPVETLEMGSPAKKRKSRLGKRERLAKRTIIEANLKERPVISSLDKSTHDLLGGKTPKKLSLHSDNLKSKTHTNGCHANHEIGKGKPMKKKEAHSRFSNS